MAHNFQEELNTMLQQQKFQKQQQLQQSILNTEFDQPSSMPTPVPYNVQNMPWAQHRLPDAMPNIGNVMQFHARSDFLDENTRRALLHVKRKPEPPLTEPPPPKQFISDEKITAHFNGLRISSEDTNNTYQRQITTMNEDEDLEESGMISDTPELREYKVTAKELEDKLRNASRITLCEDLKIFNEEQKKSVLLPDALINRIEKPCTALVLWQPPPILELLHRKTEDELKKAENKNSTHSTEDTIEDIEFADIEEIDDFTDNNNTSLLDFNTNGEMDEDL